MRKTLQYKCIHYKSTQIRVRTLIFYLWTNSWKEALVASLLLRNVLT